MTDSLSLSLLPQPRFYSIMPMNSGKDYVAREVEVAQPLMAAGLVGGNQGGDFIVQSVALRGREGGATAELGGETAYALRAAEGGGSDPYVLAPLTAVCVTGEITHTPKADGFDGSEDGSGRGQPITPVYAIQERAICENPDAGPDGVGVRGDGAAYTLEARTVPQAISAAMAVRRLMPVECERLQGFPDGYTFVPVGKKMAADGPRYKQLGNSWAVPHARWVGSRVADEFARLDALDAARQGPAVDVGPLVWLLAA